MVAVEVVVRWGVGGDAITPISLISTINYIILNI